jgi:hypothetical protein
MISPKTFNTKIGANELRFMLVTHMIIPIHGLVAMDF